MAPPSNALSDELWLSLFMFTSNDCPFHSFSAILEISAISRTAARALASRRAEHLRLLNVNLEVELEIDTDHVMAQQAADDFFETWSIDSDCHWHDRYDDRRWTYQVPSTHVLEFPILDMMDLRVRRLELAIPNDWLQAPSLSSVQVNGVPMIDASSPRPARNATFESGGSSPMSVASTVPADYDPTLQNH